MSLRSSYLFSLANSMAEAPDTASRLGIPPILQRPSPAGRGGEESEETLHVLAPGLEEGIEAGD